MSGFMSAGWLVSLFSACLAAVDCCGPTRAEDAASAALSPAARCDAILAKASKGTVLSKEEQGVVATCFFNTDGKRGIAPAIEYSTVAPGFFNKGAPDTTYYYGWGGPPRDATDWRRDGG